MLVALPHPAGKIVRGIGLTVRRDWRPTQAQARLLAILRDRLIEAAGASGWGGDPILIPSHFVSQRRLELGAGVAGSLAAAAIVPTRHLLNDRAGFPGRAYEFDTIVNEVPERQEQHQAQTKKESVLDLHEVTPRKVRVSATTRLTTVDNTTR
jgi:hypothetical protein